MAASEVIAPWVNRAYRTKRVWPALPLRCQAQAHVSHPCPVFSQQQMKLVAENLKEEWREGGKEKTP